MSKSILRIIIPASCILLAGIGAISCSSDKPTKPVYPGPWGDMVAGWSVNTQFNDCGENTTWSPPDEEITICPQGLDFNTATLLWLGRTYYRDSTPVDEMLRSHINLEWHGTDADPRSTNKLLLTITGTPGVNAFVLNQMIKIYDDVYVYNCMEMEITYTRLEGKPNCE